DTSKEAAAEASRDEFIAHISHELKTPLHTMGMYIEELQGSAANDEAFRVEGLNVLQDETERMADLINNILSITKIENGSLAIDRQRVKLADLLNDALANVKRSEKAKGITFVADVPKEVGAVAIDKNLMRVAINNLLTNAIKYNRPGGSVSLELEELQESVRIAVKDSGIGIAEEDKPNIFDKFYRSEDDSVRERTGHGLGLALVRDIVNLHNGKISVNSELDKGTEFIIEFYKESDQLRKAG
ncbi:MAG: sensor histidine kinase, partial [Pseudomonadales bacterium]